ncbi:RsiV family protein [Kaistella montana]|uniref:RsiV family protein n=1 Tax=Kaistella montana TaxID=1849733 RepID=A0ABW5KAA6_9FLAO|nr:RsiV family protein [Kaistella montana]MCQ4035027.1 RsiV family protein [Kaistella montana]
MKKVSAIFSVILLTFFSCTKTEKQVSESSTKSDSTKIVTNIFTIDSVKVDDSLKIDKNLTTAFKSKILVFPNISNKTLLDSVYSATNIKLDTYTKDHLLQELQKKQNDFYENTKESLNDWKPDFKQTWDETSSMKLFSTQGNYMTIQYTGSGYTGGAHGYYNEIYKVFDVSNHKTIQISDLIINQDPKIWNRILMTNFLENDLEKKQAEMLLVKEIPLNRNFYFDKDNLYFLYNQYEIAAYAAGPVLIKIPYTEIKPFLNPDFKAKMNL